MEQKTNRVIRCCIEMGKANPIISIHDQVYIDEGGTVITPDPALIYVGGPYG
jgi:hypothetical protein